ADAGGGQQLARRPAGADEVDPGRPAGAVALAQLGQLLAAAGGVLDARRRLAALGRLLAAQPLRLAAGGGRAGFFLARLGVEELLPALGELVVGTRSAEVAARVSAAHLDDLVGDAAEEGAVVGGDEVAERRGAE